MIIAYVSMTLDHVGIYLLDDAPALRLIGRIAMPLFCYAIYQGYLRTTNAAGYALRLLGLALLSQALFVSMGTHVPTRPNIIFGLWASLQLLRIIDGTLNYHYTPILILVAAFAEYSLIVPVLILSFYHFHNRQHEQGMVLVLLSLVYMPTIQAGMVLALPFLYLWHRVDPPLPRLLKFAYYPAHIVLLTLLSR